MQRLVKQANLVQQEIERNLAGLLQQRHVPYNALELRVFVLSLIAGYRDTLGRDGQPPLLQKEFEEALFEPLYLQTGLVFSPEARTDFGTDLKALLWARYRQYKVKLSADMRRRKALPGSQHFGGIAVLAAESIFTQPKDRTDRSNLFANRMQPILELLEANIPAPAAEDE